MRKIPLYRTLLSNFMFIFLFQLFVNLVSLFNFRKAHGWSPMVELCRWSGQITLGVWVKKGYSFSLFHFCHELLSVVKAESFTILIGATALLRSSFTDCAVCVFFFFYSGNIATGCYSTKEFILNAAQSHCISSTAEKLHCSNIDACSFPNFNECTPPSIIIVLLRLVDNGYLTRKLHGFIFQERKNK